MKFPKIPQNDAHLPKRAADEFYNCYLGLLNYINQKYHISPKLPEFRRQEETAPELLYPIDDYLWKNKDKVIDEFIKENPYCFKEEELNIINDFKNSITSDVLIVVGYLRDYTEIFHPETGKIYMVKGIRDNWDVLLRKYELPCIFSTTLLMFKGKIIYNSFLKQYPIDFGNNFYEQLVKEYESGMRYYHL